MPWYLTVPAVLGVLVVAGFLVYAAWLRLPGSGEEHIKARGPALRAEARQQQKEAVRA